MCLIGLGSDACSTPTKRRTDRFSGISSRVRPFFLPSPPFLFLLTNSHHHPLFRSVTTALSLYEEVEMSLEHATRGSSLFSPPPLVPPSYFLQTNHILFILLLFSAASATMSSCSSSSSHSHSHSSHSNSNSSSSSSSKQFSSTTSSWPSSGKSSWNGKGRDHHQGGGRKGKMKG